MRRAPRASPTCARRKAAAAPLVFVNVRHEIAPTARLALTEEHDIVYRDMPQPGRAGAAPRVPRRRATSSGRARIVPDDVLLFRYSALTFNGHRIHYDRRYVTEVEGYPGLVVHGPLIATLLLDLLRRELPDATRAQLRFKAVQPALRRARRSTSAAAVDDGTHGAALGAQTHEGALAMQATRRRWPERTRNAPCTTNTDELPGNPRRGARAVRQFPDEYLRKVDAQRGLSRGVRRRADQGRLAGRADPAGVRRLGPGPDRGVGDHGGDQPLAAATPAPATARCTTWARCCATARKAQKQQVPAEDRRAASCACSRWA